MIAWRNPQPQNDEHEVWRWLTHHCAQHHRDTSDDADQARIYAIYVRHTVIGGWGVPSEVASAVAFLASDAASYISGSTLLIDAGWAAIDGPPPSLTQAAS